MEQELRSACWHFFISVLNRGVQLKKITLILILMMKMLYPRQTLRFLSIDASLATILPPKINKVWLFVAQKVDKSFTPEQRKSENTFTKYLKRCNFYQISNNFRNLSTTNFQSKAASAHLRAGNDILMEVLNKDS